MGVNVFKEAGEYLINLLQLLHLGNININCYSAEADNNVFNAEMHLEADFTVPTHWRLVRDEIPKAIQDWMVRISRDKERFVEPLIINRGSEYLIILAHFYLVERLFENSVRRYASLKGYISLPDGMKVKAVREPKWL